MGGLHLIHRKRVSLRLGHLAALEHSVPFTTARPLRYPSPAGEGCTAHPPRAVPLLPQEKARENNYEFVQVLDVGGPSRTPVPTKRYIS